jgi:hypothetical protein
MGSALAARRAARRQQGAGREPGGQRTADAKQPAPGKAGRHVKIGSLSDIPGVIRKPPDQVLPRAFGAANGLAAAIP